MDEVALFFEIFQDRKKKYRFRLKARNGKVIAQSEGYNRKASVYKPLDIFRNLICNGNEQAIKVTDLT